MFFALIQQLYDSGIISLAILAANIIACSFTAILLAREKRKKNHRKERRR